ncbi:putative leucine-rich repeat domain superfamily [Helianthus annuus]|nr:putative leucine-rich repeat domain superfamily [Helianthus annuus]KAJ0620380.1 putative leucine-rich repeat domain superfamily [Helianthus annuus]
MIICMFIDISRSLCAIGKGCKNLKSLLLLSDCYFLSDKGLEAVAAGCSELTRLGLPQYYHIWARKHRKGLHVSYDQSPFYECYII